MFLEVEVACFGDKSPVVNNEEGIKTVSGTVEKDERNLIGLCL